MMLQPGTPVKAVPYNPNRPQGQAQAQPTGQAQAQAK